MPPGRSRGVDSIAFYYSLFVGMILSHPAAGVNRFFEEEFRHKCQKNQDKFWEKSKLLVTTPNFSRSGSLELT
jgi:hypothetical protein